jgi:hypothetical protein
MPGFEFCVAGIRFLMRSGSRILHGFEGKRRAGHASFVAAQLAQKKRPTIGAKVRVEGCQANSSVRGCVISLEPRIARNKAYHTYIRTSPPS